MNYDIIGETICTNAGGYKIVSIVDDNGDIGDRKMVAYVGRHCKQGHYDIVILDNASYWVLGDEDDLDANRDQFDTANFVDSDFISCVRNLGFIDLADWLADRLADADRCND